MIIDDMFYSYRVKSKVLELNDGDLNLSKLVIDVNGVSVTLRNVGSELNCFIETPDGDFWTGPSEIFENLFRYDLEQDVRKAGFDASVELEFDIDRPVYSFTDSAGREYVYVSSGNWSRGDDGMYELHHWVAKNEQEKEEKKGKEGRYELSDWTDHGELQTCILRVSGKNVLLIMSEEDETIKFVVGDRMFMFDLDIFELDDAIHEIVKTVGRMIEE